jgi:redox-regulated HSP33 family molecular chaperone
MPSTIEPDCPCCQKAGREFNNAISGMSVEDMQNLDRKKLVDMLYHCEWCWNRFHFGLRDKDFKTREQLDNLDGGSEQEFDYQHR